MSKAKEKAEKRRRDILNYMREAIRKNGYAPTIREISTALNIKSTSTVHKDVEKLVESGYLRKDPVKPRAIVVVDMEDDESNKGEDRDIFNADRYEDVMELPVVGSIAAGAPILAEENIEDTIPVPSRYVSGTNYILKVKGESMIEAGIMDGDMLLIEKCDTARNGDMVVAMIDGFESEATVKTYYKEEGHVRLQPENSSMNPIIVKDVRIMGKVRGVFRYYN